MREKNDYRDDTLYIDGVKVTEIAKEFGTPLYVYSKKKILENINSYKDAFKDNKALICYAMKANNNVHILKLIASSGAGADIVSGGELYMALKAGISPEKIVFSGVSKTYDEIVQAIDKGVKLINIESQAELLAIAEISKTKKQNANISFRINPDIDPKTHPKIATGIKESKFGIPYGIALGLYEKADKMEYISIKGVHLHIGSQITSLEPFRLAAETAVKFTDDLAKKGIIIEYIDLGGGLGIAYEDINVPSPSDIKNAITTYFQNRHETLILEPGRSIIGDAGYLLTKIIYIKEESEKNFIIVDAGFNDFIRPALYGSYHNIIPAIRSDVTKIADVVGPVCESGDCIAYNRKINGAEADNILVVCDAGAYGFSMSSNYNGRPRPAEVMIDESGPVLIRNREEYADLVAKEL